MKRFAVAAVIAGFVVAPVAAEEAFDVPVPGPDATVERWITSEGAMTIKVDKETFAGTYESDNGRIAARLVDGVWQGFWAEDASSEECASQLMGTAFWGRISFTFDPDRTRLEGTWTYCDATEGGGDWTGDRAP